MGQKLAHSRRGQVPTPNMHSLAQEGISRRGGGTWVSRRGVGPLSAKATQARKGYPISKEHAKYGTCGQKRGHILNVTNSEEACMVGLTNSETKSNHIG